MTERDPAMAAFDVLVGTWQVEARHRLVDEAVRGTTTYEWLEGGRFLLERSRTDDDRFPDGLSVIGPREQGEGLALEYFDSRGVRRTYGVALEDGVLRRWRDQPGFDQRSTARLGPDAFEVVFELAETPGDWMEDMRATYRRQPPHRGAELFAGLRVRDFQAARPWYERLLGEPAFLPNATEAVWTLGDGRHVYIVEAPEHAGHSVVTLFTGDLERQVAALAARGLEPHERLTYANGVRKAHYRDPDGNEIAFGGPPPEGAA